MTDDFDRAEIASALRDHASEMERKDKDQAAWAFRQSANIVISWGDSKGGRLG